MLTRPFFTGVPWTEHVPDFGSNGSGIPDFGIFHKNQLHRHSIRRDLVLLMVLCHCLLLIRQAVRLDSPPFHGPRD